MTNVVASGIETWNAWRQRYVSETVEYIPLVGEVYALLVTPGATVYDLTDENGITVRRRTVDFIALTTDLVALPNPGDKIIFNGRAYEVNVLGHAACCEYCDSYTTALRIHTVDTGLAPDE